MFKNVEVQSVAKNYYPVSLVFVVSKILEKLVNNRLVDHLKKCGLSYDFWYGFRSSDSTAELSTVLSDIIARVFNITGDALAVALEMSKLLRRFPLASPSLVNFQVGYFLVSQ